MSAVRTDTASVVSLRNVSKTFTTGGRAVRALQDVDIEIAPGETVALIGESGSGKSTMGSMVLGLESPDDGEACFGGQRWRDMSTKVELRHRSRLSTVYQDPAQALDPRQTIGKSVMEPIRLHRSDLDKDAQREMAVRALQLAHLPDSVWDRYPRDLSGGQQQRASIARAIATEPEFILLDEPTAALDAAVRRGVLDTLLEMQQRMPLAFLLISHDIQSVRHMADRVLVLYRGQVVESGSTTEILDDPKHPYTRALIDAELTIVPREREEIRLRGTAILDRRSDGCVLYGRCPIGDESCRGSQIPVRTFGTRSVACIKVEG